MSATFFVGDAIEVMNTLPEKSADLLPNHPDHREELDPHFDNLARIAAALGK